MPAGSRNLMRVGKLWLLLTVLSAGCICGAGPSPTDGGPADSGADSGSGGGGGGGGGNLDGGGLPLKSACTVLNARRCEYFVRCKLIADTNAAVRDCLALQQSTLCGPTKWQARVEVSTLRYDALLAQQCADVWETRKCSDYGTEPNVCGNRYIAPNAFPGQACYDGYKECLDGACRGKTCPRRCQVPGTIADPDCRETADCTTGLFCKLPNLVSGIGACTAYGLKDSACDADQPCAGGFICNAGKCAQLPTATFACVGASCDDGAWCLNGPDGGTCKARLGLNALCTDDSQCLAPLLCEALTGLCVPRALNAVAASCGLRQTCPTGTVCLNATATALGECQPPLDAGTCVSSNDCQTHLACVGLDGGLALACGPRQGDGMRCSENRDCQLLSICKQQTCVRLPTTSDSCTLAQSCLFGPCVPRDGGSICTEPFGPGVVCARDSDCSSSRCVTGKCLPSCTP